MTSSIQCSATAQFPALTDLSLLEEIKHVLSSMCNITAKLRFIVSQALTEAGAHVPESFDTLGVVIRLASGLVLYAYITQYYREL